MNLKENRFEEIKRNFFDTAVADVYRAIDGGSFMGAFVLTSCLIDYGSAIMTRNSEGRMKKWISRYLEPQNQLYGLEYVQETIVHIRHGLIHSYGSFDKMVTEHMPLRFVRNPRIGNHLLHEPGLGGRIFSLYYWLPHVTIGLWNTFRDLENKQPNKYAKDMIQVIGRSEDIAVKSYSSMHKSLALFDDHQDKYRFESIQVVLQDMLDS